MLLITTIRIPNGYRILVAVPGEMPNCWWHLYRNGHPMLAAVITGGLANVVSFDLKAPLALGVYELGVTVGCDAQRQPPQEFTITLFAVTDNITIYVGHRLWRDRLYRNTALLIDKSF